MKHKNGVGESSALEYQSVTEGSLPFATPTKGHKTQLKTLKGKAFTCKSQCVSHHNCFLGSRSFAAYLENVLSP